MIRPAFAAAIAAANATAAAGEAPRADETAAVWAAFDAAVRSGEFFLSCDDVPALGRDGEFDLDDICDEAAARDALAAWLAA